MAYTANNSGHLLLPVVFLWALRNKDKISTGCDTGHQSQPSTMTTHDLDNESSRVRRSCSLDVVNHLADSGEGGIGSNGPSSLSASIDSPAPKYSRISAR